MSPKAGINPNQNLQLIRSPALQISAPTPGTASSGVTFSGASLAPYVISGILRDFTPALNPDFGPQPDGNDRGIVANLIDPDALPGAAQTSSRA